MAAIKAKKPTSKLKAGQKKKINKWLILGGVAAIAAIGVLAVRYSSASSYTFIYKTDKMSGGKLTTKNDGTKYRLTSYGGTAISTLVSSSVTKKSKSFCAHYKVISGSGTVAIYQTNRNGGVTVYAAYLPKAGGTGNVCTSVKDIGDSGIQVIVNYGDATIGVDTMYGK